MIPNRNRMTTQIIWTPQIKQNECKEILFPVSTGNAPYHSIQVNELCATSPQKDDDIVARRAVTRQRPRYKQIYQSRYWVTRFSNKTRSQGNDLSNVSTATNQHETIEDLLETVFSTALRAEELWAGRSEDLVQFCWMGAAIQRGHEPGNRGIATVRHRYQATTSGDTGGRKRLSVCSSDLRNVVIGDGAIIKC
jgi:hypothetical protein